ncbi:MAG: RagB/SusD family nutrient uptake outer membrane protein [Dehalococcoidia bacterium]
MKSSMRRSARRVTCYAVVIAGVGLMSACDMDEILNVELPGQVLEGDLNDPSIANLLVRSAISQLECSWDNYTGGSSHHSDEYMNSSGNAWWRNMGWRQLEANDQTLSTGGCGTGYAMYAPLHTARFQANDVYNRLSTPEFAEIPDRESHLATLRAITGYTLVALGEGFCEMSVPEEEGVPGPLLSPVQTLQKAELAFTQAIEHAQASGNDDALYMALVGRARVRLDLGDYPGVIEDASLVPGDYLKVATRGSESGRRFNSNYNNANSEIQNAHGTVTSLYHDLTIDPDGRPTQGDGVPDPRVNVEHRGVFGHNSVTPIWHHDKYTSRSSPVPIASYKEAQLFLAEAHVRQGDGDLALGIINARRTELELPVVTAAAVDEDDEIEMMDLVIEERRRELFVEAGHRMNDMLRFEGTPHEIPWLGDPGSIHPNGLDSVGGTYGDVTCFPLPTVERIGNPNISGA